MGSNLQQASQSVLRIGGGRGFVVEGTRDRYIVTAAHCLPELPPPHLGAYLEEQTYPRLVAPLGQEPQVWAECLFVDPVGDIALLGCPDNQAMHDEANDYEELTESAAAIPVCATPREGTAWALSLDGRWVCYQFRRHDRLLNLGPGSEAIQSGMSGSPVVDNEGRAIGVVSTGSGVDANSAMCPRLDGNLPGWALLELQLSG